MTSMRYLRAIEQTARWLSKGAASLLLVMGALGAGAAAAGAHGSDGAMVHGCIVAGGGGVKIVGANESCQKNDIPLDWPAVDTNTTYRAGAGLSLSAENVFSVTGAPWDGLSGVPVGFADNQDDVGDAWNGLSGIPAGFADGVDDVGQSVDMKSDDPSTPDRSDSDGIKEPNDGDGFVHWNNLEAIPNSILDAGNLSIDDGTPDEQSDPVSFSKIKDLTHGVGANEDGRITSRFLANGTITAADLAGSDGDTFGNGVVAGAVTSAKILDNTVETRDLSNGAVTAQKLHEDFRRTLVTKPEWIAGSIDPQQAPAGERIAVKVDLRSFGLSGVARSDIVTVSPPPDLEPGLVFSGSDVLTDGELTIYLYNVTLAAVDSALRYWTVRVLR